MLVMRLAGRKQRFGDGRQEYAALVYVLRVSESSIGYELKGRAPGNLRAVKLWAPQLNHLQCTFVQRTK